ncbi:MAG: hypothetical protein ABEJ56_04635 [Candidatus Nanohaloarchaea archaeon]
MVGHDPEYKRVVPSDWDINDVRAPYERQEDIKTTIFKGNALDDQVKKYAEEIDDGPVMGRFASAYTRTCIRLFQVLYDLPAPFRESFYAYSDPREVHEIRMKEEESKVIIEPALSGGENRDKVDPEIVELLESEVEEEDVDDNKRIGLQS